MSESGQVNTSYRRVWDAFCQSKTTLDGRHDTPRWQAHGGIYAAGVIRVDATALQPALDDIRAVLEGMDGVRIHPDPFLHIMLQELGFVEANASDPSQMTLERLEEFAQSSIEPVANTRAFSILLGGVNAFRDAVFLEARAAGELVRLHERLFELAAIPRVPKHSFLPQCTIAQFTRELPVQPVQEVLAPFREIQLGAIEAHEVEIVTFDTSEAYPQIESYAVIPFKF